MVNWRFARATWGLLAFLLAVVAWGAFVRATGSGAGCGAHWPVCNGEVLPRAPALETVIEFSHRVSSALVTLAVVLWAAWGFLAFPRGHRVRWGAVLAVVGILLEGAIGAALVLLRLTGKDDSLARAGVMCLHLVNTFLLLAMVALSGAWAAGTARPRLRDQGTVGVLVTAALLGLLVLGVTGAIAALGDTLFPARIARRGLPPGCRRRGARAAPAPGAPSPARRGRRHAPLRDRRGLQPAPARALRSSHGRRRWPAWWSSSSPRGY